MYRSNLDLNKKELTDRLLALNLLMGDYNKSQQIKLKKEIKYIEDTICSIEFSSNSEFPNL